MDFDIKKNDKCFGELFILNNGKLWVKNLGRLILLMECNINMFLFFFGYFNWKRKRKNEIFYGVNYNKRVFLRVKSEVIYFIILLFLSFL